MTNRWWPLDNINNMWEVLSNLINIFYRFVTHLLFCYYLIYQRKQKKKKINLIRELHFFMDSVILQAPRDNFL